MNHPKLPAVQLRGVPPGLPSLLLELFALPSRPYMANRCAPSKAGTAAAAPPAPPPTAPPIALAAALAPTVAVTAATVTALTVSTFWEISAEAASAAALGRLRKSSSTSPEPVTVGGAAGGVGGDGGGELGAHASGATRATLGELRLKALGVRAREVASAACSDGSPEPSDCCILAKMAQEVPRC